MEIWLLHLLTFPTLHFVTFVRNLARGGACHASRGQGSGAQTKHESATRERSRVAERRGARARLPAPSPALRPHAGCRAAGGSRSSLEVQTSRSPPTGWQMAGGRKPRAPPCGWARWSVEDRRQRHRLERVQRATVSALPTRSVVRQRGCDTNGVQPVECPPNVQFGVRARWHQPHRGCSSVLFTPCRTGG